MFKQHPRPRILRHMTVSYTIFLLIPIVMGSIFLYIASQVLQHNLQESNARHLSSGVAMVSDSLTAADEFTLALSQNEAFLQLLHNLSPTNSYTIRHVANSMPKLRTINGIADRYFFYYHGGNEADHYLIAPQVTFRKPSLYYDSCFRYGEMSSAAFWDFVRSHTGKIIYPATETRYLSTPAQSLLMITPFPYEGIVKTPGHFLIYFDLNKIMNLFTPLFDSGTQWMGIYDANGQLLGQSSTLTDAADVLPPDLRVLENQGTQIIRNAHGKYTLLYERDRTSGWLFVALTPNHFFSNQVAPLLWVVLAGVSIFIILAFFLIGMLNKNSQRPLAQLASLLPVENENQRGLWPLMESVEKLKSDNEELISQLSVRNTQLRDAAIVQLIKGTFEDEQEFRMMLAHTGVEIEESPEYRGIYMKLLHQDVLSEATMPHIDYRHTVLSEALRPFSPAIQWLTLKNEKEYILLYTRMPLSAPLEELLTAVYSTLKNICGVDAALFVGIPCKNLRTLNQSFASAKALSMGEPEGEKYLFLAEPKPLNKSYDYSAQDEAALLAAAQRNERDKLNTLLDQIYERNFRQRQLSSFLRQGLFSAMIHTLSRSDCPLPLPPELMNIPVRLNEDAFFHSLRNQYLAISDWIQENRHRDSRLMLDNVLNFIDENFGNENMSLTYTAMHFGLTEQYLSEGFKRRAGMNFSTYLERKRVLKAQEMLRTTQINVQLIAESVGYSNIRTFRRAYSRVLGHPPSVDRKEYVEGDTAPEEEKWRERP